MKAYMGFDCIAGSEEGACLIFANSSKKAKKIGYPIIKSWHSTRWVDMRVKWLRKDYDYFKTQANQEKLSNGISHVIESVETCSVCLLWGVPLINGVCENCIDQVEE